MANEPTLAYYITNCGLQLNASMATVESDGCVIEKNILITSPFFSCALGHFATDGLLQAILINNPIQTSFNNGVTFYPINPSHRPTMFFDGIEPAVKVHDTGCVSFTSTQTITASNLNAGSIRFKLKIFNTANNFWTNMTLSFRVIRP